MNHPSLNQRVLQVVDAHRQETIDLLSDLVRIPSVNHPPDGDELACQEWLADYLRAMGMEVDVFAPDVVPGITSHPGWSSGGCYRDRPNVVGRRRGTGGGRSLLLLSHADVVPPGPAEMWRHGPFNPTVEDGALIGRGTNDDKGGIAASIMALRCVEAAGLRLRGDVVIASVVDEESAGANGTLGVLQRPYVADGAVYCDGVDLDLHLANLGGAMGEVRLQLQPDIPLDHINRIHGVVDEVCRVLNNFAAERTAALIADHRYSDTVWPDLALRIYHLEMGSPDASHFSTATMKLAFYTLPDEEAQALKQQICDLVRKAVDPYMPDVQPPVITWIGRMLPASACDEQHPFVDAVDEAYHIVCGTPARRRGMPMSDLFQFNLHSPHPMPSVAMGVGRWNVEGGAHQPNESVLIDEHMIPFVKILALLMVDWCGVEPR